jgi:hypothetical protein
MSIPLSPKHGVNPAIPLCFFCNKPKNEIVLPGRLPGDEEAPRNTVWDMRPCDECAGYMKQGIILISCRDGESLGNNPYRTGGWVVIKEDAIRRMIDPGALLDSILQNRFAFVHDAAWKAFVLPRCEE